ncbi:hypothetical protein KBD13_02470 [Patescibacteria group bacterium]|jgi:hypothetical protein|nr:hypothetical protein [Patescibacteria group bacterium]
MSYSDVLRDVEGVLQELQDLKKEAQAAIPYAVQAADHAEVEAIRARIQELPAEPKG